MGTRPTPRRLAVNACCTIAQVYVRGRLAGRRDAALRELVDALRRIPPDQHRDVLTEAAANVLEPPGGHHGPRFPGHDETAVELLVEAGADRAAAEQIATGRRERPRPQRPLDAFVDRANRTERR